jgi:transmembrane sensor
MRILRSASTLEHLKHFADLQGLAPFTHRARAMWLVRTLGGVGVLSLLVALLAWHGFLPWGPGIHSTHVAELREISLPDGSVVTLGAKSRIRVRYADYERRVELLGGQAFFAVARNTSRPFYVVAEDVTVRVVGTKFDVSRGSHNTVRVAVLEGRVNVSRASPRIDAHPAERSMPSESPTASTVTELGAGEGFRSLSKGGLHTNKEHAPPEAGAWRTGQLAYTSARLADVIDDLNRYYGAGVSLASDELGELEVTAAFQAVHVTDFLQSLPRALPVAVEFHSDGAVLIRSRPPVD